MPYHIRKMSKPKDGKKWEIVRDEDNVVVGRSTSRAKALRSIGHRMAAEPSGAKSFKKGVKNSKSRVYGETDLAKKTIVINKRAHKNKKIARINPNKNGTEKLISTIVHEEKHANSPRMHEKNVRKFEKKAVARMSAKQKARKYAEYRKPIKVL